RWSRRNPRQGARRAEGLRRLALSWTIPPVHRTDGCAPSGSWLNRHRHELAPEPDRRPIDDPAGEMPPRRGDVVTPRATDGGQGRAPDQLVAKALDRFPRGAPEARSRKGIEWNQGDLGRVPREQARQLARMLRLIVHAVEHHVLEG